MSPRLRAARLRVRLCSSRRQLELIAKLPDDRPAVLCRNSTELLVNEAPAHRHLWDSVASVEECQRAVEVAQRAMLRCCDNDGDHGKLFPPHVPEASHFLGDDGFALFSELRRRGASGRRRLRASRAGGEPAELDLWLGGRYRCRRGQRCRCRWGQRCRRGALKLRLAPRRHAWHLCAARRPGQPVRLRRLGPLVPEHLWRGLPRRALRLQRHRLRPLG